MAKGRNLVFLDGRLGTEPEATFTDGGTAVVNGRLATPYRRRDGDDYVDATEWHNITAFGSLAEIISEYAVKGQMLHLEGFLRTRSYTDKDGVERQRTEVVVQDVILGRLPNGAAGAEDVSEEDLDAAFEG